jgi:threonine/homoserine/homoserine lactone efflux protein
MADYLAALPLGFILSFSFGPLFFILLETSISKGLKQAFFMDLGVAFSDFVFFSTAYLGASKIITEENQPALFILGGVMLSAYGFLSFVKTQQKKNKIKKGKAINKKNLISFPIKGFLLNIINVAVLFFWTGLLFVIGPSFEMNPIKIWTFFLLTVATYLIVNLCKFYLASRLKSKLTDTLLFKIKQALNVLIFVCGAFFVFKGI